MIATAVLEPTLTHALNALFSTSVNYGASATITGQVSCTFSPVSGLSSVQLTDISVWDSGTNWTDVSSNGGAFPFNFINDGSGNSQVVTFSTIYNNAYVHTGMTPVSGKFYVTLGGGALSAGSGDTIDSTISGTYSNSSPIGVLSAIGDAGSPSGVTAFSITNGINSLALTWTNPLDSDFAGVLIQRASGTVAPSAYNTGTCVTSALSPLATYSDVTVAGGHNYAYSLWAYDNVSKIAITSVSAIGMPKSAVPGAQAWETELQARSRLIDEGII